MGNQEIQKNRRVEDFMKEYRALTQKYRVDMMSYPVFVPTEKGKWEIMLQAQPVDLDEVKKAELDKAFISKP